MKLNTSIVLTAALLIQAGCGAGNPADSAAVTEASIDAAPAPVADEATPVPEMIGPGPSSETPVADAIAGPPSLEGLDPEGTYKVAVNVIETITQTETRVQSVPRTVLEKQDDGTEVEKTVIEEVEVSVEVPVQTVKEAELISDRLPAWVPKQLNGMDGFELTTSANGLLSTDWVLSITSVTPVTE